MADAYRVYHVEYETFLAANQKAVVAAKHVRDIPFLLEVHVRHRPSSSSTFRTAKDISFKVHEIQSTGLTTDKEAVLFPFYKELKAKGCLSMDTVPHCNNCGHIPARTGCSYKCLNCGGSQ